MLKQLLRQFRRQNLLVQIKPTVAGNTIYLMKTNQSSSLNKEWKAKNPYIFLSKNAQLSFGGQNQLPSLVGNNYLKLYMLKKEIAKHIKTDGLYVNKDVKSLLKPQYVGVFKY